MSADLITGVKSFNISLQDEQVTVETNLPSGAVQQILEETGRKAILRGHGTTKGICGQSSSLCCEGLSFLLSHIVWFYFL